MRKRLVTVIILSILAYVAVFAQSQSGPVLQRRPVDPNAAPAPVYTPDQQSAQQPQPYPQTQQAPAQQYPQSQQQQQYLQTQQYPQQPPYQQGYAAPNTIPTGATFMVRLKDNLDSNKVNPGKKFTAELAEDLLAPDGSVLIPRGKKLHGHITE